MKYDGTNLDEVLEEHRKWLSEEGDSKANLREANLSGADLSWVDLSEAVLRGAVLRGAVLRGAVLSEAVLSEAVLSEAVLSWANLSGANLSWANLSGANLRWANLIEATMPDGRKWEEYRLDHYAGICDSDEVRAKAGAAWGSHTWKNCPMHKALGISSTEEAGEKAKLVGCWVALYDSDVLPEPKDASDA